MGKGQKACENELSKFSGTGKAPYSFTCVALRAASSGRFSVTDNFSSQAG